MRNFLFFVAEVEKEENCESKLVQALVVPEDKLVLIGIDVISATMLQRKSYHVYFRLRMKKIQLANVVGMTQ